MTRTPRTIFLLGVAALLAGCTTSWARQPADASAQKADARPRLSRVELIRGANAVCTRRFRKVAALGLPPRSRKRAEPYFAKLAALERAEVVGLLALRPPAALEERYVRLVGYQLELARAAGRFHRGLAGGDTHERRLALADLDRLSEKYDRAARRLGLRCRQTA